jgi:hypothetical protein
MRRYRGIRGALSILFLLAVLGGCSSVTVRQPLPRMADADELAAFEGEWVSEGQVLYVRFGADGIGRFAGVDWKDDRFRLDEGEIIISKGTERSYLSVRVMENGKWSEGYYIAQYRFTGQGDLILWLPDIGAFADAVGKGRLDGVVEKGSHTGSVLVTSAPEKVMAFLNNPANGAIFDYREPMIIKKLLLAPPSREVESISIPEDVTP